MISFDAINGNESVENQAKDKLIFDWDDNINLLNITDEAFTNQ